MIAIDKLRKRFPCGLLSESSFRENYTNFSVYML